MSWSPSNWFLAQTNHVLAGPAVYFGGVCLCGWEAWHVALGVLVVTVVKEFVLDVGILEKAGAPSILARAARLFRSRDTYAGSARDFAYYQVGSAGAWLALLWFWPGLVLMVGAVVELFVRDVWDQHGR